MWIQFFLENGHFALNILAALVTFGVAWLYSDAYTINKKKHLLLKISGFLLLSVTYLVHTAYMESTLVPDPLIPKEISLYLVSLIKMFALILIILGLVNDPLQPKPGKKTVSFNLVFTSFLAGLAPLAFISVFINPVLSALVAFLYLRRATVGLEHHIKTVAFSFFLFALSDLLAVGFLFNSTLNADIFAFIASFGPLWLFQHFVTFLACMVLLIWLFSYLFKSLTTQIFFTYVFSIVVIFLITGITFSFLLVKNVESDTVNKLQTDIKILNYVLESKSSQILSDTLYLAQNPETKIAMSDVTKNKLKTLTREILLAKKLDTLVITDENAKVLIRAEDFERFGDSLSSDEMIKKALLGAPAVGAYLKEETLTSVILLKSAVPVISDDSADITGVSPAGVVIAGTSIDNAFADGVKKATGLEINIFSENKISATTLTNPVNGKRLIGLMLHDKNITALLSGEKEIYTAVVNIAGTPYLSAFLPVLDVNKNPVGLLSVAKPHVSVLQTAGASLEMTIIAIIILLVLAILPAKLISQYLVSQLR